MLCDQIMSMRIFTLMMSILMSSKNQEANGFGYDLDLLIILY